MQFFTYEKKNPIVWPGQSTTWSSLLYPEDAIHNETQILKHLFSLMIIIYLLEIQFGSGNGVESVRKKLVNGWRSSIHKLYH